MSKAWQRGWLTTTAILLTLLLTATMVQAAQQTDGRNAELAAAKTTTTAAEFSMPERAPLRPKNSSLRADSVVSSGQKSLDEPWCPLVGDLDCSCLVEIGDIMEIAGRFGTTSGDPGYDLGLDLVPDGVIDVADVAFNAERWQMDCSTVPYLRPLGGFSDLPDPARWSQDLVTGARFRRATQAERAIHDWPDATFLIEAPDLIDQTTRGAPRAQLLVPLWDNTIQTVDLELYRVVDGLTRLERTFTPNGITTILPMTMTLPTYVTQGFDFNQPRPVNGSWMELVAGNDGGVFARGLITGASAPSSSPIPEWVVFEFGGPNPGWQLETLSAPGEPLDTDNIATVHLLSIGTYGGIQASGCDLYGGDTCEWLCAVGMPCDEPPDTGGSDPSHCADGLDNDGDGGTDYTGDQECAHHPDEFWPGTDPDVETAYWSCDLAPASHRHKWESGESFVLFGEGRFCTKYQNNWFERLHIVAKEAVSLVNAVAPFSPSKGEKKIRFVAGGCWIFPGGPVDGFDLATQCNNDGICNGVPHADQYPYAGDGNGSSALYGSVWSDAQHGMNNGLKDVLSLAQVVFEAGPGGLNCIEEPLCNGAAGSGNTSFLGASVIRYDAVNALPGQVSAHEFGHGLNMDHDNAIQDGYFGFMHDTGGPKAVVSNLNAIFAADCLTDWQCPRPSGFRYSPP